MSRPNFTPADLDYMSIEGLAELPPEMLGDLQRKVGSDLAAARRRMSRLNDALDSKYRERAAQVRRDAGKDFGVARFCDGETFIEADLKKSVIWDQDGLRELWNRIDAASEDPKQYMTIKTELTVSERAFASWSPQIQAAFAPYRTVKPAAVSYKVLIEDQNQE
jgi:hypothetical protein